MDLGRLKRVPIREVWQSESADFTPWLARPDNIELLGDTLGLDLEVEAQEKQVGPFRADILCRGTVKDAGSPPMQVLIENQLERTDHTHLGQLVTYAAGLDAVVIVWIAERFQEEHRAALDWLNELGNERLRCFGLEIEGWRIGDSPIAPKFNVISQPNDWARSVAASAEAIALESLSDTRQLQRAYWSEFARVLLEAKSLLRPQKPAPQNWMNLALGRSGIHLTAIASTLGAESGEPELRAEVTIDHPTQADTLYEMLAKQRAALELELGELSWVSSPEKKVRRIFYRWPADIRARSEWSAQHAWLRAKLEALHRAFGPRVRALTISDSEDL